MFGCQQKVRIKETQDNQSRYDRMKERTRLLLFMKHQPHAGYNYIAEGIVQFSFGNGKVEERCNSAIIYVSYFN
jgi:hypothetical protein